MNSVFHILTLLSKNLIHVAVRILLLFRFFISNECGFLHSASIASCTTGEYAEVMNAALILLTLPFAKVVNVAFCSLLALLHAQMMNLALCILVFLCKQMVDVAVYILLALLCAQVVNETLCVLLVLISTKVMSVALPI